MGRKLMEALCWLVLLLSNTFQPGNPFFWSFFPAFPELEGWYSNHSKFPNLGMAGEADTGAFSLLVVEGDKVGLIPCRTFTQNQVKHIFWNFLKVFLHKMSPFLPQVLQQLSIFFTRRTFQDFLRKKKKNFGNNQGCCFTPCFCEPTSFHPWARFVWKTLPQRRQQKQKVSKGVSSLCRRRNPKSAASVCDGILLIYKGTHPGRRLPGIGCSKL